MNKKVEIFLFLTLAGVINAIGVNLFLSASGLLDSGLSGTSFLLDELTPGFLSMSLFIIILNIPFYVLGYKRLGKHFVICSVYAIVIYSFCTYLLRDVFDIRIVENEMLLSAVFGGLLSGVGSGLVIRKGGAIDGIEVLAVLVAKRVGLTVGTFVMIYNVVLYIVSALIFSSWNVPLYSIIAYAIGLKSVDFIVEGLDRAKSAIIITNNVDDVSRAVSMEFERGITIIDAKGYYSNETKKVIYCVVNRFEIMRLKRIVRETDENAFVTITEVSETISHSFKRG